MVVHLVLTIGMLLFVKAIFDFGLPRCMNIIGALSAALFGVVFLLQAVSSLVPQNAALDEFAFGLLGNWPEHLLVLGTDVWFVGLLLLGSEGRTRLIGWAIVPVATAYHLISVAGAGAAQDQRPESRGVRPPAPVRVAVDRRRQTKRAGSLGTAASRYSACGDADCVDR